MRKVLSLDGKLERPKAQPSPCGKLLYSSRKLAAAKAKASQKMCGELITYYRCANGCRGFHIGHPPYWAHKARYGRHE